MRDCGALVAPACSGLVIGDIRPYPIKQPVKSLRDFPVFFSETSRSSLQVEHLSSKVLSRMLHNRT